MTMNWELATQVAKDRRARIETTGKWMGNDAIHKYAQAKDRERYTKQAAAHYKGLQEAAQARRAGKPQPKEAPLADKKSANPNARADWGPSQAPSADAVDLSRWDTPNLKPRTPGKWGAGYGRVEHGEHVLGGQWRQPARPAPAPSWSKNDPVRPAWVGNEVPNSGKVVGYAGGSRISTTQASNVSLPHHESPGWQVGNDGRQRVEIVHQAPARRAGRHPYAPAQPAAPANNYIENRPRSTPMSPNAPAPNGWIENRPRSTPTPPGPSTPQRAGRHPYAPAPAQVLNPAQHASSPQAAPTQAPAPAPRPTPAAPASWSQSPGRPPEYTRPGERPGGPRAPRGQLSDEQRQKLSALPEGPTRPSPAPAVNRGRPGQLSLFIPPVPQPVATPTPEPTPEPSGPMPGQITLWGKGSRPKPVQPVEVQESLFAESAQSHTAPAAPKQAEPTVATPTKGGRSSRGGRSRKQSGPRAPKDPEAAARNVAATFADDPNLVSVEYDGKVLHTKEGGRKAITPGVHPDQNPEALKADPKIVKRIKYRSADEKAADRAAEYNKAYRRQPPKEGKPTEDAFMKIAAKYKDQLVGVEYNGKTLFSSPNNEKEYTRDLADYRDSDNRIQAAKQGATEARANLAPGEGWSDATRKADQEVYHQQNEAKYARQRAYWRFES